jgi:hypothetical protein
MRPLKSTLGFRFMRKTMPNSSNESPIRESRAILITCSIIFVCFAVIPFIFLFRHDPSFGKKLLFLIFAPIIGYLFYLVVYTGPPFFLLLFSKKTRSDNREISKLEKVYLKSSRRLIIKRFGLLAYFKFFGRINKGLNSGYEYCTNLLQHKKAESEDNLRFYIFMQLYECSILDGKYRRAIDYLEMAQKIKPGDFLTCYWTAEVNELIGNAEKAIGTYQNIIANSTPISENLKVYLNKQVERVKTQGPKSPSPMPGLKYMSYQPNI